MRPLTAAAALVVFAAAASAATPRDNDATCDIGLYPAATLLLPYFEVDLDANGGETTLFTITNTSNVPQIARVTLWTDWAFPVLAFNLYLTGYDVQSVNLRDVIVGGRVAPPTGTGWVVSPVGAFSTGANPLLDDSACAAIPPQLGPELIARMQQALTLGRVADCRYVGQVHENAVGYATVDVVRACTPHLPTDRAYFGREILFDNVLTGDYQQVHGEHRFAQGSPLVHIRAIPEGGTAETRFDDPAYTVNFTRTFYSRLQLPSTPNADARQPLPSIFAARWISGSATTYRTLFKIWREAVTPASACAANFLNADIKIREIVLFDEEENPRFRVDGGCPFCSPARGLPAASLSDVRDEMIYPEISSGDVGGWVYLNLDQTRDDKSATQAWVTVSMRAQERYSIDADAIALGNGCTPPIAQSSAVGGKAPIGPAPNGNP